MKHFLSTCMVLLALHVRAQLFTQNFEGSTILSDYYNSVPGINQFNSIKTNGSTSAAIINGRLSFTHLNASTCGFYRNTDFIPAPKIIQYKFDIEILDNTASQTTAAVFYIGSGLANGVSEETNLENVHSRIGVNISSNTGEFSFKPISGSTGNTYTGQQNITWVINNSDSPFTYIAPDGSNETLAVDTWDLWIGTVKEFNDKDAETPTQDLKNFKFVFTKGTGTIDIDNITITDFTVLPVELLSFKSEIKNSTALLRWSTASEKNSSHFNIYRSTDGEKFEQTASITAAGNSTEQHQYSYRDDSMRPGINYYRLEQEDFNGRHTVLGLTLVKNEAPLQLKFLTLNQQEAQFSIYSPKDLPAELTIRNSAGQTLEQQSLKLKQGYNQAVIPLSRCRGLHIASLKTSAGIVSQKLLW